MPWVLLLQWNVFPDHLLLPSPRAQASKAPLFTFRFRSSSDNVLCALVRACSSKWFLYLEVEKPFSHALLLSGLEGMKKLLHLLRLCLTLNGITIL